MEKKPRLVHYALHILPEHQERAKEIFQATGLPLEKPEGHLFSSENTPPPAIELVSFEGIGPSHVLSDSIACLIASGTTPDYEVDSVKTGEILRPAANMQPVEHVLVQHRN